MGPEPSSFATLLFTAGAVVPFGVIAICFVLGLVKR
jgi:hypothetical protein